MWQLFCLQHWARDLQFGHSSPQHVSCHALSSKITGLLPILGDHVSDLEVTGYDRICIITYMYGCQRLSCRLIGGWYDMLTPFVVVLCCVELAASVD